MMEDRMDRFAPQLEDDEEHPEVLDGESQSSALLALFFYSAMMFTLPILTFFGSKQCLENNNLLDPSYDGLALAIASIVMVQVVILMYVYRAYKLDQMESKSISVPMEKRKKLN